MFYSGTSKKLFQMGNGNETQMKFLSFVKENENTVCINRSKYFNGKVLSRIMKYINHKFIQIIR